MLHEVIVNVSLCVSSLKPMFTPDWSCLMLVHKAHMGNRKFPAEKQEKKFGRGLNFHTVTSHSQMNPSIYLPPDNHPLIQPTHSSSPHTHTHPHTIHLYTPMHTHPFIYTTSRLYSHAHAQTISSIYSGRQHNLFWVYVSRTFPSVFWFVVTGFWFSLFSFCILDQPVCGHCHWNALPLKCFCWFWCLICGGKIGSAGNFRSPPRTVQTRT